jgi:cell division protein FtsQ
MKRNNKDSKRRMRKRKRILNFVLFVMIITLLYLFAFKTKFFDVKSIEVSGNKKMSYEKIVNTSTFIKGENIFRVSKKLGEESLNRLPYIKNVKIKRKLPSTMIIEVEERKEIAIVPYIGSFVYIDDDGYILSIEGKKGETQLPQIFGLELVDLEAGENLFDKLEGNDIRDFIVFSEQAKLLQLMKYINFSDNNNTKVQLNNDIKVAFGPLDNVKYKLSFLSKILKDIEKKDLDVRQILFNKGDNPIIVIDNK